MKRFSIKKILRSARFKFFLVSVSVVLIVLSFNNVLSVFNTTDPEPSIQPVDIEVTRKFEAFTVHVDTGLFIRNFSKFDIIKNEFTIGMVVWFRFDPTEISVDTIGKFSFENGRIKEKSPPDVKIEDDKVFVKYNVIVELKSDLKYQKFPLEDHRLAIVLTNNFVTPYEVMFEVLATDFVIDKDIFVANWNVKKLDTNFGIDEDALNQIDKTKKIAYSKAAFTIDFVKSGIRKTFIIFVPIFIVFFLSLFSFFLTLDNLIGRTTLAVSSLSALLAYRFVIEGMMPKVGYFTTTDYVYIILLFFSFITFVFHVVITRLFNIAINIKHESRHKVEIYSVAKDIMFVFVTSISTAMLCLAILQ